MEYLVLAGFVLAFGYGVYRYVTRKDTPSPTRPLPDESLKPRDPKQPRP